MSLFNEIWPTGWTAWNPTLAVSGGTPPTYTSRFVSRYCRLGDNIFAMIDWANTTGGTAGAGANAITVTYPGSLTPANVSGTIGTGKYIETGAADGLTASYNSASTFLMALNSSSVNLIGTDQSTDVRAIRLILMYEVA